MDECNTRHDRSVPGPARGDVLERQASVENATFERCCPLCAADNTHVPPGPHSAGPWKVKNCLLCRFVYLENVPGYEVLREEYSWSKSKKMEKERRASSSPVLNAISMQTRWRLRLIRRRPVPRLLARYAAPGNVIDLGCGAGKYLKGAPEGYIPHGVEIGRNAAQEANRNFRARGGFAVNAPALEGLRRFGDRFFTAAVLRSYLEHEMHPAEVLSELRRTLFRGGVAIVKVPNFGCWNRKVLGNRWCGFRHPDHVNYFTPRTLREMGEKCGFRVWQGLRHRLPTSDNMYAVLTKLCVLLALV